MSILYFGTDHAKNVFALHSVNEAGKLELVCPSVLHTKLHELVAGFLSIIYFIENKIISNLLLPIFSLLGRLLTVAAF